MVVGLFYFYRHSHQGLNTASGTPTTATSAGAETPDQALSQDQTAIDNSLNTLDQDANSVNQNLNDQSTDLSNI